jgi:hypothetical protein
MAVYLIGLDLGQAQDSTALAVLEMIPPQQSPWKARYALRHLERPELGTPYPSIVARTRELMLTPPLAGHACLVVDATGVGRAVVDLLLLGDLNPIAVTITGGDAVTRSGRDYRVPKRDLVATMQVLLQTQRLRFATEMPLGKLLAQELLHFRVKIDLRTAHDSYEAWREGMHDDLVLATALACWWGEQADTRPRDRHAVKLVFRQS